MATDGLVLFSLDVADYPHATRKVASWVLLGMGRLARQLPDLQPERIAGLGNVIQVQRVSPAGAPRALLLVDEVGALGHSARHLRGLVGRARESGLAVVLATQGPSDLEAVDRALLPQVLQDTAWQLAFRQGSPQDAERMQALFGKAYVEDLTRYSDGRFSTRHVERPRVSIDEWMNALEPGDAWLRVAPIDRGWRQERPGGAAVSVRAFGYGFGYQCRPYPTPLSERRNRACERGVGRVSIARADSAADVTKCVRASACAAGLSARAHRAHGRGHPREVELRWPRWRHELGPCLVWRDGEPTSKDGRYGRIYDPAIGKTDYAHLVVWRRCFPDRPIPKGMTVDHLCRVTLCQRPDHLQGPVTRAENTRRRHQRA